mmetsp:Transcript_8613/g.35899  ORF Transcript_8613/g.35899 Transcript_8613/m.35899 type:complete len:291 (+) Transcript_8613:776-1648(+)
MMRLRSTPSPNSRLFSTKPGALATSTQTRVPHMLLSCASPAMWWITGTPFSSLPWRAAVMPTVGPSYAPRMTITGTEIGWPRLSSVSSSQNLLLVPGGTSERTSFLQCVGTSSPTATAFLTLSGFWRSMAAMSRSTCTRFVEARCRGLAPICSRSEGNSSTVSSPPSSSSDSSSSSWNLPFRPAAWRNARSAWSSARRFKSQYKRRWCTVCSRAVVAAEKSCLGCSLPTSAPSCFGLLLALRALCVARRDLRSLWSSRAKKDSASFSSAVRRASNSLARVTTGLLFFSDL